MTTFRSRFLRAAGFVTIAALLLTGIGTVAVRAQDRPVTGGILIALERELRAIVKDVVPSVVTIRSTCRSDMSTSQGTTSPSLSVGSGVIMDSLGRVLTTARVVEDADDFWVEVSDGRLFQAILVGVRGEVAVLQINANNVRSAPFDSAAELGVGSLVAAVGNSYGFAGGLSWGEVNGFRPDGTIQLSLGVSAGSSGGALIDARGRVVGMIRAKVSEPFYLDPLLIPSEKGQPSVSIPGRRLELPTSSVSLAMPIGTALRLAHLITESGAEAPAYVGVYVEDLTGWYAAHFKTDRGVLVTGVAERSPAARFGLQQGDVITSVDRQEVVSVRRFRQMITQARPGQRMLFDILRGGWPLKVVVELGRAGIPHLEPLASPPASLRSTQDLVPSGNSIAPAVNVRSSGTVAAPAEGSSATEVGLESRFRDLERTVDSLQRELSALRRDIHP